MRYVIILSLMFLNVGCASMSDVLKNKGNGLAEIYPVSKEDAYKITRQIFLWEGADAIEERRDKNLIFTSKGVTLFTWGTLIGAWIEPVDSHSTMVTVLTKRKFAVTISTGLSEDEFHKRFAQAVIILKSGKPLPNDAP